MPRKQHHVKQARWGSRGRTLLAELKRQIESGDFQPGQKLPSMRQLCTTYGVSLDTVRMALRSLEELGMIQTRARSGSRVTDSRGQTTAKKQGRIALIRIFDPASAAQRKTTTNAETFITEFEYHLLESSYQLVMVSQRPDATDIERKICEHLNQIPDLAGVLLYHPPSALRSAVTQMLDEKDIRWLAIDKQGSRDTHNIICPDYAGMGQVIGQYLAALQVERLWYVTLDFQGYRGSIALEKVGGITAGYLLAGAKLPELTCITCPDNRQPTARDLIREMLETADQPPQAIVCHVDPMAMGALEACRAHGLKVPRQVAVLGTTGTAEAEHTAPSLTTFQQHSSQMAQAAAETMTSMILYRYRRTPAAILAIPLCVRGSSPINRQVQQKLAPLIENGLIVLK